MKPAKDWRQVEKVGIGSCTFPLTARSFTMPLDAADVSGSREEIMCRDRDPGLSISEWVGILDPSPKIFRRNSRWPNSSRFPREKSSNFDFQKSY